MAVVDNTDVEWQLDAYSVGDKNKFIVGTANSFDHSITTDGGRKGTSRYGFNLKDQIYSLHSHSDTQGAASDGDMGVYSRKYWDLNGGVVGSLYPSNHFVYNVKAKTLFKFDSWKANGLNRRISKSSDFYNGFIKE